MIETEVLILGGGLAGLSAAYHLGRDHLLVEKDGAFGGRAASVRKDGFLFDHTGHLLHLHDPRGRGLVLRLLKGNLRLLTRSAWVRSSGVFTPYPFQANTFGLPAEVRADCVAGFAKNLYRPRPASGSPSFEDWCLGAFGEGICRHFMFPYNRKLWRTPLSELTVEWQGRFLPRPAAQEVLYGALMEQKKFFGYNAFFRYPARGGIQSLPDALASGLKNARLNCRATAVDLKARRALIEGLGEVRYERLVNTLALPDFLGLCRSLPPAVVSAGRKLRSVSVHNLNLGVKGPAPAPYHWAYFPEKEFPFYRAGFSSNFSKDAAPKGCHSMYVEVSRRPDEAVDRARLERECLAGLRRCGLLKGRILSKLWIDMPHAYVVYDRARAGALDVIGRHLSSCGVESIGRWGAWKYSFMEESLLDGKRCAELLMGVSKRERVSDGPLAALR